MCIKNSLSEIYYVTVYARYTTLNNISHTHASKINRCKKYSPYHNQLEERNSKISVILIRENPLYMTVKEVKHLIY